MIVILYSEFSLTVYAVLSSHVCVSGGHVHCFLTVNVLTSAC